MSKPANTLPGYANLRNLAKAKKEIKRLEAALRHIAHSEEGHEEIQRFAKKILNANKKDNK